MPAGHQQHRLYLPLFLLRLRAVVRVVQPWTGHLRRERQRVSAPYPDEQPLRDPRRVCRTLFVATDERTGAGHDGQVYRRCLQLEKLGHHGRRILQYDQPHLRCRRKKIPVYLLQGNTRQHRQPQIRPSAVSGHRSPATAALCQGTQPLRAAAERHRCQRTTRAQRHSRLSEHRQDLRAGEQHGKGHRAGKQCPAGDQGRQRARLRDDLLQTAFRIPP